MKSATQHINTKQLRAELGRIVEKARRGASFLVLHRSRPAFQIIPPDASAKPLLSLEKDSLYRAAAVGKSKDKLRAEDYDGLLYRR